ncbi:hypothetical protein [Clostridium perfringens]|uniref:hypothetical protein n=1 Tax=Clostridium perfringens TaxID=1502 RepID=UPI0037494DB3
MSKSKVLKDLYNLTMEVYEFPESFETKEDLMIEWLEINWDQDVADELIDKNICPRCKDELRLDRNSSVAYLKCYNCDTKY